MINVPEVLIVLTEVVIALVFQKPIVGYFSPSPLIKKGSILIKQVIELVFIPAEIMLSLPFQQTKIKNKFPSMGIDQSFVLVIEVKQFLALSLKDIIRALSCGEMKKDIDPIRIFTKIIIPFSG